MGKGTISVDNSKDKFEYLIFVECLKHNILTVSQMVDKGNEVTFYFKGCKIRREGFRRLVAKETRASNNIYVLNKCKVEDLYIKVLFLSSYQ